MKKISRDVNYVMVIVIIMIIRMMIMVAAAADDDDSDEYIRSYGKSWVSQHTIV